MVSFTQEEFSEDLNSIFEKLLVGKCRLVGKFSSFLELQTKYRTLTFMLNN